MAVGLSDLAGEFFVVLFAAELFWDGLSFASSAGLSRAAFDDLLRVAVPPDLRGVLFLLFTASSPRCSEKYLSNFALSIPDKSAKGSLS